MRKSMFAGLFYPREKNELLAHIRGCFSHELGPGDLFCSEISKNNFSLKPFSLKALIVPHAGFSFSGMCAAHSYKLLQEQESPELIILIGPSHNTSLSGLCDDDYETPLGVVKTNVSFANSLSSKGNIRINNFIHSQEHSIEVQIPFLQFIYGKSISKIKILPLLVSYDSDLDGLSSDLKRTIGKSGLSKILFIVSSDFTHYGPNYSYTPFTDNIKEKISSLDKKAINYIIKNQPDKLKEYLETTGATVCGQIPIRLLLKTIDFHKAKLLKYYLSGDVTGDYENSVSYASISFE